MELLSPDFIASDSTLTFGMPLFGTIAIKRGGSENVHVDVGDHKATLAIVAVFGNFTGGELCLPQTGDKVPLQPGQVIAFRAGQLAHFTAPVEGTRMVITGFTDHLTGLHARIENEGVIAMSMDDYDSLIIEEQRKLVANYRARTGKTFSVPCKKYI